MSRYIDIEPYEKDGWYLQKQYHNSYGEVIKTTPLVSVPTAEAVPKEDYMALRIASQKVFDSFRKRLGEIEERLNAIDIHCIECKHHEDEEPGMVYCPNIVGGWVSNNFYCGNAERKNEVEE